MARPGRLRFPARQTIGREREYPMNTRQQAGRVREDKAPSVVPVLRNRDAGNFMHLPQVVQTIGQRH